MNTEIRVVNHDSFFRASNWLLAETTVTKWTPAENKWFETALLLFDKDTPDRWMKLAAAIPGKTVSDVINQYRELGQQVHSGRNAQETEHQHAFEEMEHQAGQETEHQHTHEEMEHQAGQETEHQVDSGRNALGATEESKKERNKTSFNISYKDLQQHLGKKIDDVIKELGVSRSTFKRIIRSHGITRWPSNAKNKKNPSIFEASNGNKRVRGNRQETLVSSSNSTPPCLDQNVLLNNDIIGSSQNHIELPKTDDAVIIKATFGDDTVKIQFCISSNMEKLIEEVVTRFNLTVGSFKLKYFDEDDEWMLLARDDDLKLCIKTLTSLGKTPIRVSVQSI